MDWRSEWAEWRGALPFWRRPWNLRKLAVLAVGAGIIGLAVFWIVTIPATVPASALAAHTPNLENGRTMFYAGGCTSCHAIPGEKDHTRLGGGLGLKSPFGTFYVPNISPHPRDGIGRWSEQDFVNAMWRGTSPRSSHYFPAFPYTSYHYIRLEDLRDLFAFIKTLPAVEGKARDHDVPFPFNVRRSLGGWKMLFFDDSPFTPDPSKSPQWNRGAYLVNGPGHCAECHSPRNLLGGIKSGQRFAGGPNPEGEGWVPNITQARLKDWSESEIAYLLETGTLPDGDSVGGQMAAVVRNTGRLSPEDRKAMALYIKSLPPVAGPTPPKAPAK
jgi:mono/diheme cytochrome c family protein